MGCFLVVGCGWFVVPVLAMGVWWYGLVEVLGVLGCECVVGFLVVLYGMAYVRIGDVC